MKFVLEELDHQQEALKAIMDAVKECHFSKGDIQANPIMTNKTTEPFYIDIKMETGTGKTYVYTRTMYELHKNFGINKFIIFVPSLAIKEGTKKFIEDSRQHFAGIASYENTRINLYCINAGDFKVKSGRKIIPSQLINFLEGTQNDKTTIECLLLSSGMLSKKSSLTSNDYDQTLLFSTSCPFEAIKMIKPIIIIDEPHHFKEDNSKVWWSKIQELEPQMILRFGATFPTKKTGKGKNITTEIDYKNLVYDLNAVDAFNKGLVKFIDIQYPENVSQQQSNTKYKVRHVDDRTLVLRNTATENNIEFQVHDPLPQEFEGVHYDGEKKLDNGMILFPNMEIIPDIWAKSYQELLLKQALDAHFEVERANWIRENCGENPAKIKTLALFFIDDIGSYRPKTEGAETWLKDMFERLLRQKLKETISTETIPDYKDFLEESLRHISCTHMGYFSGDNEDKKFQEEVDKILRGKDKLLSFKDENGKWELCRFLFSKWTLKEGWDNPNVFTITKLRTSGSENSKIQEVGRGLRLPVDENGRRVSDQEFRLNFIIDWSESDFANKLYGEITSERTIRENDKLEDKILEALIAAGYGKNESDIIKKLLFCDIIDFSGNQPIIKKPEELNKLLPESWSLNKRAITVNKKNDNKVKLRKENWNQLKNLWQQVVQRYMIKYDSILQSDLEEILQKSVVNAFTSNVGEIIIQKLVKDNETGSLHIKEEKKSTNIPVDILPYGKFLKELSKLTCVGVNLWNKAMCQVYSSGMDAEKFNTASLQNIVTQFKLEFEENFIQKFDYDSLDFSANTSLMKGGEFVDDIPQNELGTNEDNSFVIEANYLYDKKVYDSEPEKEILQTSPRNEVIVFGKLPKRCIQVPKYTGGTTSPDFIYAIKKGDDVKINLFVEAKPADKTAGNKAIVASQKKFFDKMKNEKIEWREIQSDQSISNIINDLLKK